MKQPDDKSVNRESNRTEVVRKPYAPPAIVEETTLDIFSMACKLGFPCEQPYSPRSQI